MGADPSARSKSSARHTRGVGPCIMCRWLIYFGDDVLAYDLLYRTANALIGHQSEDPNVREQIIRAR